MNYSFVPYFDPDHEDEFFYFQGYQLTDFSAYTLAICSLPQDNPALISENALQDMLEMIKHVHLYHHDWLKGCKINLNNLFELVGDQILLKFPHETPFFALFNTKENGTVHILKKTHSYRLWLLRGKKLYCLDRSTAWMRFILGYRKIISSMNKSCMTEYRWHSKANDQIFLQKEQRSLPKKKKSLKKLMMKLLSQDQQKLHALDIFAQINLKQ